MIAKYEYHGISSQDRLGKTFPTLIKALFTNRIALKKIVLGGESDVVKPTYSAMRPSLYIALAPCSSTPQQRRLVDQRHGAGTARVTFFPR